MLTFFYSPRACSFVPHVVLEEIGVPYHPVRVTLSEGEHLKPEYLAINPRARVPVLKTDRGVLTECGAILTYLARTHPQAGLLPTDPWAEAQALSWMSFLASSVHIAFAGVLRPARFATDEAMHPHVKETGQANVLKLFADIEGRLTAGSWALGDYSVVDPYLSVFMLWAKRLDIPVADFPNYAALARRVWDRPAARRAAAQEGFEFPA